MKRKIYYTLLISFAFHTRTIANEPIDKPPLQYRNLRQFTKWFSTLNAGGQFYLGDHDKQIGLGKRITPSYEISIGKWLNQSFGIRGGVNGYKMKGLTKEGPLAISNEIVIDSPHYLYNQEFNFINIHTDLLFHWSNDAYDLDLSRLYNMIPYAGIGVITATNMQRKTNMTMNLGFIQTLRLNKNWDLNLDIRGNIISDSFDGEIGGKKFEGNGSATLGFVYNFR